MELIVKPVSMDISYQVVFKEALLEAIKEEGKIALIGKFLKTFELSVDAIRFSLESQSSKYMQFSKYYGLIRLDVSFGFEKVEALIMNPQSEAQVLDLFGKVSQVFENIPISVQKISIRRQLSTDGDVNAFLESLNPYCPEKLKEFVQGRGVSYAFKIPENNLIINFTIVNSLFVPGGIYISIENEFAPNLYDFQDTFKIVKEYADLIVAELKITFE
jgi:hypothetical protein